VRARAERAEESKIRSGSSPARSENLAHFAQLMFRNKPAIERLAIELLVEIFCLFQPPKRVPSLYNDVESEHHDHGIQITDLSWITVTHVSRFWRQTALENPKLWQTISISIRINVNAPPGFGFARPGSVATTFLARSGSLPLDVSYVEYPDITGLASSSLNLDRSWYPADEEQEEQEEEDLMSSFWEYLATHSERIRELHLDLHGDINPWIEHLIDFLGPNITSLQLWSRASIPALSFLSESSPYLTRLSLDNFTLILDPTLNPLCKLTHLYLSNEDGAAYELSYDDLMGVLSASAQTLVVLALVDAGPAIPDLEGYSAYYEDDLLIAMPMLEYIYIRPQPFSRDSIPVVHSSSPWFRGDDNDSMGPPSCTGSGRRYDGFGDWRR